MTLTCFGFLVVFSCQMPAPAPPVIVCPSAPAWSMPFQRQLADEFEVARPGGAVRQAVKEYMQIRKRAKACRQR